MTDPLAVPQDSGSSDSPPSAPRPGGLSAWLLACRPATLTAALSPVAVGTAIAHRLGDVRVGPVAATFAGALLLQIASNFSNDVFDYEKGADSAERLGPTRAVQAGLVSPRAMKRGLLGVLGLVLLIGAYLTTVAGPAIIIIGLSAIVAAIAYTGGPFPLGYHGLGDLFVMIFFGFVAVCGTIFVHMGQVPLLGFVAALAPGALATNILVVNNVRDRHTDASAGKRTLAVRFGRTAAEFQYRGLSAVAYLVPLVLFVIFRLSPWSLLPLITLPQAWKNVRQLKRYEGRALNRTLVSSAKLVFFHSILLALGIFVSTSFG